MNQQLIESLGLNKEEIMNRIVNQAVTKLFQDVEIVFDHHDEEEYESSTPTKFKTDLAKRIRDRVDTVINAKIENVVIPRFTKLIDDMILTQTNAWGEQRGEQVTFTEYVTASADNYLQEPVDFKGIPKPDERSYSWKADQTRLLHMVSSHLQSTIERGMKDAVKKLIDSLDETLQCQVQREMAAIAGRVKVSFTGR